LFRSHMQLFDHPSGAALQCLVLLTAPLRLRNLQAALDVPHSWPEVLGQASVLHLETLA
ncbi:MAG: Homoserine dehydrogenase, partial [Pseudomonadota bacterium]|nr:Homoserine dehydrogenase [Pseudomonadota bacterium]